ncbi:type II toxin-antitoxin system HipA family toxin YjjJ [Ramlibacter rhizophilus]|uniref:Type II toxin-antitoxin system HipA family toxin YjjJ n=1 Tax=Ramlibacter rhizophilus TaxID=1781167 RepID=A0A4Z0BQP8_9BURK|nr:type II toxin-antitoxin system HipA family toxin YjjJ [Ramlibacter rhizophilus]TFZ01623.1 type II toxin-antitoxin system HipA family toxin YjjJ [Ramlibacter rhizophilus]
MEAHADLSKLRLALARWVPASAGALAQALQVSVPTVHRMLQALPAGELHTAGKARRTRYGLKRALRGGQGEWPVYAIDAAGQAHEAGRLVLLRPDRSWLDLKPSGWPVPDEARGGWWPGLPYPVLDMRPQGYMGRLFARAEHEQLGVAPDPRAWTDDDVLHVLLQRGSDASGNLVIGDVAFRAWQRSRRDAAPPLEAGQTAQAYARLAEQAVTVGVPGSSAAGEFPKFAARRLAPEGRDSDTPHVLVKFSGADDSPAVRRWSDLLVCEHLALAHMRALPGVLAARSRILAHAGRTFLEVERFDRHGEFGRSPLATLDSLNAALIGMHVSDWSAVARHLAAEHLIAGEDVLRLQRLWWFGRLIANTDMHAGNLSFRPHAGRLELAPAYDMLPMLQAPLPGGEAPTREFDPPLPLPGERTAWHEACRVALDFWEAAAQDTRISAPFRTECERAASALRRASSVA